MANITIYPQDVTQEPKPLTVPDGSAFYWAKRILQLARPPLLQFTAEVQNLPYLGYIAQPDAAAFEAVTVTRISEQCERAQSL
jgi:hypothetical protein